MTATPADGLIEPAARATPRRLIDRRPLRSLVSKLILLLVVFLAVPVIIYAQFRQADLEKRNLLLQSAREQGRLVAEGLRPILQRSDPSPLAILNEEAQRFATPELGIEVLYRPAGDIGTDTFYFVASVPELPAADLAAERDRLIERGVLAKLAESCWFELPVAVRYDHPSGGAVLLSSITGITTPAGCWAVITTHAAGGFLGSVSNRPYWQSIEVQTAAAIYVSLVAVTLGLFLSIWRGLAGFQELARSIRRGRAKGASFERQNRVPELAGVAEEFDHMTSALGESAQSIRLAAEDNAHAFKTPIAIIRQSVEPLKRIVPEDNPRGQRALTVLDNALDRLDDLVASARRLDQTTAELLDPPMGEVDLSHLAERLLQAYANGLAERGIYLRSQIQPKIVVSAGPDLLETIFENAIDNALEVAPRASEILVEVRREEKRALLAVHDRGPGVPPDQLDRIFERYVSIRTSGHGLGAEGDPAAVAKGQGEASAHMGIGLWIVRRNLRAIGGSVYAENREGGGFSLMMHIPLAR